MSIKANTNVLKLHMHLSLDLPIPHLEMYLKDKRAINEMVNAVVCSLKHYLNGKRLEIQSSHP